MFNSFGLSQKSYKKIGFALKKAFSIILQIALQTNFIDQKKIISLYYLFCNKKLN